MIVYASSTGTRQNLCAMNEHGVRLLFSAAAPQLYRPGWRYALDNGAWTAHQSGADFPWDDWRRCVVDWGAGADWCVAPDVVGGGRDSLALSVKWLPWMLSRCRRVVIAVQDGVSAQDVAPHLGPRVGVAIGGSTEWKEAQLGSPEWRRACRQRGAWLHALRVNTQRRIKLASGFDSIDGTSITRFSCRAPMVAAAASQGALCATW